MSQAAPPSVRIVKPGEPLAISADALRSGEQSGRQAIWWDLGVSVPQNEYIGSTAIVYVRGSLEHHAEMGCDSYDGICERVHAALECDDVERVILCIDSPGGVVSGLNETVKGLRDASSEAGKPLIAYVDEIAASAAFALACACEEIYLPRSGICGSIGVISTMFDQVAADRRVGLNFATLTSGARKADGHPHVAISEASLNAEQRRVDRLAKQFFQLVADVRPLTTDQIRSFEAGIFLGNEAVRNGLADGVMAFNELMALVTESPKLDKLSKQASSSTAQHGTRGKGNETDRRADPPPQKDNAMLSLKAQIARASKALKGATDKDLKAALKAELTALEAAVAASQATRDAKTKIKHKEVEHTEESDEGEEEEESEESEESEASAADSDDGDDSDDKDSGDDGDDEDEEESESEEEAAYDGEDKKAAKAVLHLAEQATGKRGRSALGALAALVGAGKQALARVEKLEAERNREQKTLMIDRALASRRINRTESKDLRGKPMSFVKPFLEMRKRPIIAIDEESLIEPSNKPGAELPGSVLKEIDRAVKGSGLSGDAAAQLRTKMIDENRKQLAGLNGDARY